MTGSSSDGSGWAVTLPAEVDDAAGDTPRVVVEGLSTVVALIDGSKGGGDVLAGEDELVVDGSVVVEPAGDVEDGETLDGGTDVVVDGCAY